MTAHETSLLPPGHFPRSRGHFLMVLGTIFGSIWLLHIPFLKLPYYWDEAGYFIPAAHDIYTHGSFIPFSTLSNAHPPLVMSYLALAWKLFGFHHVVTRTAMLLVVSAALLGTFRLAERVANVPVAIATVLCTALYPVFFAQSSLAHLDMMVTALTIWALVFYVPGPVPQPSASAGGRRLRCIVLLSLAAVTKETAVLIPVTLCGWEIVCSMLRQSPWFARFRGARGRSGAFSRHLPCCWLCCRWPPGSHITMPGPVTRSATRSTSATTSEPR